MDTRIPDNFDPRQVSLFLDKIDRDREAELAEIARRRDTDIAAILGEARAEARRLFRHGAEQLRARLELERSRDLARLRSALRRQQWGILVAAQQQVIAAVAERLRQAWEDPERQTQWCRFWLDAALQQAGGSALEITLGQGAIESVRADIENEVRDHPAGASVKVDSDAEPGIRIEWGDYILDGRLDSQIASISEAVLGRLSDLLNAQDEEAPL